MSKQEGAIRILLKHWKEGTFYEILEDWKWILSYSARYKGAVLFYVFLGVISTSLGLASSIAGKYLIDIITGYQTERLVFLILVMVGTTLFSLGFECLVERISVRLGVYINNDIQADIFDKIMDADWMELRKYSNGDILNRFNSDIQTVSSNAISWIPNVVISIYRFAATFVIIWHYDHIMAVIALASAPVVLLVSRKMVKKQREYGKRVREASSDLVSFEVETISNFDTIKSFGVAPQYSRKIRKWQGKYKDALLEYNLFSIGMKAFMAGIGHIVQFVAFGYCLYRLWTHDITYGTMTLFLQQRANLSGAFDKLVGIVPNFLNSSISAHRIRELVELPREVHIPESKKLDALAAEGFEIKMKNVEFSYEEDKKVIKQSGFVAKPGEIVALVGPSGEGKTTMIRLLLGLIRPEAGKAVLIAHNGERTEMNVETRHLFAYVPQGNTIFSGSIADNLRVVKEDATDEEIVNALQVACAWEFVEKMPEGINSNVGEHGRGLSEGQAQRIAIARAILRNSPILLLDEATSSLDVATERRVLRNIIQKQPNKTCVVTTHRPSVLTLCQRVYRVMDKRVTELSGEEAEQMAKDF